MGELLALREIEIDKKKIVPQYVTGISRGATTIEREQN